MAESKSLSPAMARYAQRERSPIGRIVNDITDRAQDLSNSVRIAINVRRGNETPEAGRTLSQSIADGRADKAEWRQAFKATGQLDIPNAPRDVRRAGPVPTIVGDWHNNASGMTEARVLVGQSKAGFHHAVEVRTAGTQAIPAGWSAAVPTQREAWNNGASVSSRVLGNPAQDNSPKAAGARDAAFRRDFPDGPAQARAQTSGAADTYRSQVSASAAPRASEAQKTNSRMRM